MDYHSLNQSSFVSPNSYASSPSYANLQPSYQQQSINQHHNSNQMNNFTNNPVCNFNCKCCEMFQVTGILCPCNQIVLKNTTATQTNSAQMNFKKEDYFMTKTSAYQLLQAEINRMVTDRKFKSATDDGFETAVTDIMYYFHDLHDTPKTRDLVRQRLKKRIYNQNGYEKIKKLADLNGVGPRKVQYAAVKRSLSVQLETTAPKQPRYTSPSPPPVELNSSPNTSLEDLQDSEPEASPGPVRVQTTTKHKNVSGVTFSVGDIVCIARSKTLCDYAELNNVWNTTADITYMKKNAKGLKTWLLDGNRPYTDSVHINTIVYSFRMEEFGQETHRKVKELLSQLF